MTKSQSESSRNSATGQGSALSHSSKPVLMIVDDDDGVQVSLRVLFNSDYDVVVASSGRDAMEVFQNHPVDVAVVDINMPGMSGIQLLEKIKRVDPFVEVVILTGQGTLDTSREALRLGAYGYLTKPFELAEGRETIQRALDRRRQMLAWRDIEREQHQRKSEQEIDRVKSGIYASVIHDLNSPLTATIGLLELLSFDLDSARRNGDVNFDQLSQNVRDAHTQMDFCASVIHRYLNDMRRPTGKDSTAEISVVLNDLQRMIRVHPSAKKNQCIIHKPEEPSIIKANGLDLLQALVNLALNALQASEKNHHVEIYCRHLPGDDTLREIKSTPNDTFLFGERLAEGTPMVSVTVQDDGPGISTELLPRVFDDYYSTKDYGAGTGLGLSVVQRVIAENDGAIHLHSAPGEGTAFTLFLPAIEN